MNFGNRAAELAGIVSALLGWRPQEFWNSTPAEVACALGLSGDGPEPVDGELLNRLRAQFPDE
jgi:hypothetical protein